MLGRAFVDSENWPPSGMPDWTRLRLLIPSKRAAMSRHTTAHPNTACPAHKVGDDER